MPPPTPPVPPIPPSHSVLTHAARPAAFGVGDFGGGDVLPAGLGGGGQWGTPISHLDPHPPSHCLPQRFKVGVGGSTPRLGSPPGLSYGGWGPHQCSCRKMRVWGSGRCWGLGLGSPQGQGLGGRALRDFGVGSHPSKGWGLRIAAIWGECPSGSGGWELRDCGVVGVRVGVPPGSRCGGLGQSGGVPYLGSRRWGERCPPGRCSLRLCS